MTRDRVSTLTDLYIDGRSVAASTDRTFEVVDPSNEEVIALVADAGPSDADSALDAAESALGPWSSRSPRDRSEILRRAFEKVAERSEEIARLIVAENGKPLADARAEVSYAGEFFRWFSEEAVRVKGEFLTAPSGSNRIIVTHQPIGIAVLVTPWNFPAAMLTRKIAPALAAGCTVVCKPAEDTPLTALLLASILHDAGLPRGVVNVVPTSEPACLVDRLLRDRRVRKLSFTGSTEVGRALLRSASDHVLSSSMELGGNAPFFVFSDADIDKAVEGAMVAKMRNGGEACTAANRFYVEKDVAREFTDRLTRAMGALTVGPGLQEGVEVGPLVNHETRQKVTDLVEEAVGSGASVRLGAKAREGKGFFYPPTVLDGVDRDAAILSTEIFGPVAPIVVFSGETDAIALANASEFGLVSYLYTNDLRKGLRVAEAIESGMIGLNRGLVSDPAAPFGGMKQSGLGREGGDEGIYEFLETKYISTSW